MVYILMNAITIDFIYFCQSVSDKSNKCTRSIDIYPSVILATLSQSHYCHFLSRTRNSCIGVDLQNIFIIWRKNIFVFLFSTAVKAFNFYQFLCAVVHSKFGLFILVFVKTQQVHKMSSEKPDTFGTSVGSSQALQPADDENAKSCWVCFATEADDRLAAWVQPCKCIGTTKWVSCFGCIANSVAI